MARGEFVFMPHLVTADLVLHSGEWRSTVLPGECKQHMCLTKVETNGTIVISKGQPNKREVSTYVAYLLRNVDVANVNINLV